MASYSPKNQKSRFMRTKVKIRVISEEGTGGKKYKNLDVQIQRKRRSER